MTRGATYVRALGGVALACFVAHAAWHVARGEAHDLLWTCNCACLVVAVGALAAARTVVAVGLLWLSFGVPMWILDLTRGGSLVPTSVLTHVGGLLVAVLVLRRLGWPEPGPWWRGVWWKAVLALLALVAVSRVATPPAANVHLAFAVYHGWERTFPSYGSYLALAFAGVALTFLLVEKAAARALR